MIMVDQWWWLDLVGHVDCLDTLDQSWHSVTKCKCGLDMPEAIAPWWSHYKSSKTMQSVLELLQWKPLLHGSSRQAQGNFYVYAALINLLSMFIIWLAMKPLMIVIRVHGNIDQSKLAQWTTSSSNDWNVLKLSVHIFKRKFLATLL